MNDAVRRLMAGDLAAERDVERFDQIIRMHPDYEVTRAGLSLKSMYIYISPQILARARAPDVTVRVSRRRIKF